MMSVTSLVPITVFAVAIVSSVAARYARIEFRRRRYTRGRQLGITNSDQTRGEFLTWGNRAIPRSSARRHFLVVGTTGSGKSLLQRRLIAPVLTGIESGKDQRALIFDAKNDTVPFLKHIGVTCPVYSLNPLESRTEMPQAVRWDIAADIQTPARAMNLVANLIPSEKGGSNQYFTDAARQVVTAVCESFIRHTPNSWRFSDLVYATLCQSRIRSILIRDEPGREVLEGFFGDDRTAYQVFTTIYLRMAYYRPVAAMWQRTQQSLSLRHWLTTDSVLLIGSNATVKSALDAINEQVVRVIVEEIDEQTNCDKRETWIWIDEARLCGPLLKSDIIPYAAVKARSRGGCLLLGFQDIDGFREVAGTRIANEIVAQCSHKALLRMESKESAKFASDLVGAFETIERFSSDRGTLASSTVSVTEQRVNKQTVLPSEFYNIPLTTKQNGLTGYFLSPTFGAIRDTVKSSSLAKIVSPEKLEMTERLVGRTSEDQVLLPWTSSRELVLGISQELDAERKRIKVQRKVSRGPT